jgi:hypothetical protein
MYRRPRYPVILHRGGFRQVCLQFRSRFVRESGQGQGLVRGAVGDDVAGTARRTDDRHASASERNARGQEPGGDLQFFEAPAPHDPGLPQGGVDRRFVARDGAGMSQDRLLPRRRSARFQDDDGFSASKRPLGEFDEAAALADLLEEHGDHPRLGIRDEIFEHVRRLDDRLVAETNDLGQADGVGDREFQHDGRQRTALQNDTHTPTRHADGDLLPVGRDAVGRVQEAGAIRAQQRDPVAARLIDQTALGLMTGGTRLAEAGRDDDGVPDTGRAGILEHGGNGAGRSSDIGEVDWCIEVAQGRDAVEAKDARALGVDRHDTAGKADHRQIGVGVAGPIGIVGRTDDGQALRRGGSFQIRRDDPRCIRDIDRALLHRLDRDQQPFVETVFLHQGRKGSRLLLDLKPLRHCPKHIRIALRHDEPAFKVGFIGEGRLQVGVARHSRSGRASVIHREVVASVDDLAIRRIRIGSRLEIDRRLALTDTGLALAIDQQGRGSAHRGRAGRSA